MKLHHYPDTDSLYIDLKNVASAESEEVRPGVVLDMDSSRQLVGIDIQNASRHLDPGTLEVAHLPTRSAEAA